MTPETTVDLRVWGVDRMLPALGRMATGRLALGSPGGGRLPGLRFAKLLGTGSAHTFTPRDADLHHWAVLTVWEDAEAAERWGRSRQVRAWDDASYERLRVRMVPLSWRGRWSRVDPFAGAVPPERDDVAWQGPVVALTRARLRPTRARSFWRAVPPVVTDLTGSPGLRLALGIGEAPVGTLGTLSLWERSEDLVRFAYDSPAHRSAMARTVPERWYAEELFARLAVREVDGHYRGSAP